MYADDTHITYAGVDVNAIQLKIWITLNTALNTAKTEFMLIG